MQLAHVIFHCRYCVPQTKNHLSNVNVDGFEQRLASFVYVLDFCRLSAQLQRCLQRFFTLEVLFLEGLSLGQPLTGDDNAFGARQSLSPLRR